MRRFEKKSNDLQASCDFVRRFASLALSIRVCYPGPIPLASLPEGSEQEAEEAAPPELSQEFVLPLAPLLVRSRNGSAPELVEDVCSSLACEGLSGFRFGVTCSAPLLSDDIAKHLNPMLITVDGVHKMPRDEHIGQTPEQVRTVLNAFGERCISEPKSLNSKGGAKFRFCNIFFIGTWKHNELRDFLQSERLVVEVHDRGKPSSAADRKAVSGSDGATSTPTHFGAARFSLAEITNMRRVLPVNMRVQIAPVAVGSGASSSVPGKLHRKADVGSTVIMETTGSDDVDLPDSGKSEPASVAHERAPGYIEYNSYVSITVEFVQALHPHPLPMRTAVSELSTKQDAEDLAQPGTQAGATSSQAKKPESAGSRKPGGAAQAIPPPQPETIGDELLNPEDGEAPPPRYECYQRLAIVLQYRMSSKVRSLLLLVKENNRQALKLGRVDGSRLEDYELTEEQKKNRDLDILTGFIFLDRRHRIIVIEGLRDGAAWPKVLDICRVGTERNSKKCKILYHPNLGCSQRLYADFNLQLKQIKLRMSSLEKLLLRSEVYNITRSDQEATAALMSLADLKRVERLHHLKASTSFPTAKGMCAVETHYGVSLTDLEIEGGCALRGDDDTASEQSRSTLASAAKSSRRVSSRLSKSPSRQWKEESEVSEGSLDDIPAQRAPRQTIKEPLNCDNLAYRKSLSLRTGEMPTNFVHQNKELLGQRSDENARTNPFGKKIPDQSFLEGVEVFHAYSGQALNTVEMQKRAIRQKLAGNEHKVLLTYSEDKNSGCFPLLDYDVDLAGILRAPDRNWKDSRDPWRYPKPRPSAETRKPTRDVSDARKEDLNEIWDEGALSAKLECKKGPMHNVFDSKSLGTGGAHVIDVRRPGLRNVVGAPAPPATRHEREVERGPLCPRIQKEEMKIAHFNNMGTMSTVDKYNKGLLESAPAHRGLCFEKRNVTRDIADKYGKGSSCGMNRNIEPAPVSIQIEEDFREEPRNSNHPFHLASLCAKDLVHKVPLSARETKMIQDKYARQPLSGTLTSWQRTGRNAAHLTFQKPAFAPQAVTPLPLSAR
jgi:hypothetical protein